MKKKGILFALIILSFCHPGIIYAQQGQGPGNTTGSEQPFSYMFGKEHYLPDSPEYMVGKQHYLPDRPYSKNEGNVRENGEKPFSKGETASGERGKSGDPGNTQVQVEINFITETAINAYGIIFPVVVSPRHRGRTIGPPPKVNTPTPDTGKFNPNVSGGQFRHHPTGNSNQFHYDINNLR